MARKGKELLSAKQVARLVEPGRYRDGGGLYLQVLGPSNRSWIFRYTVANGDKRRRERWRCRRATRD